jgi:polyprenyl-phospho-N-acetylgalactosaminyl synthase
MAISTLSLMDTEASLIGFPPLPERSPTGQDDAIWVVIPAFNEAKVLPQTLADVFGYFKNVVVVDDNSADETSAIAHARGAHVCKHPINLGQGAALQTGIDFALRNGAERIVTFDADGQHQADDAARMAALLDNSNCDVVLATRFKGSAIGISYSKRIFLLAATVYTRLTTGLGITDTHNGLRVFRRSALTRLRIAQNRMAHASEILEKIASLNLSYTEAPCTIIYTDYSKAKGQRMIGAIQVLADLTIRRLYR